MKKEWRKTPFKPDLTSPQGIVLIYKKAATTADAAIAAIVKACNVVNALSLSTTMQTDSDAAWSSLEAMPPSPQKRQALDLLAEIEGQQQRNAALLDALEAAAKKCAPSAREQRVYRFLPWVAGFLALAAIGTGMDALWSAEYCSRGRTGPGCIFGLRAQLEGAATVAIGLLIAIAPAPSGKSKSVAVWILGMAAAGLVLAAQAY